MKKPLRKKSESERAVNPVKSSIAEAIGENSTEMDYVIKANIMGL